MRQKGALVETARKKRGGNIQTMQWNRNANRPSLEWNTLETCRHWINITSVCLLLKKL